MRPGQIEYRLRGGDDGTWYARYRIERRSLLARRCHAEGHISFYTFMARRKPEKRIEYETEAAWAMRDLAEIERIEAEIAVAERAPVTALAQAAM